MCMQMTWTGVGVIFLARMLFTTADRYRVDKRLTANSN